MHKYVFIYLLPPFHLQGFGLFDAYLKMCYADFGNVSSSRSEGAQCSCILLRAVLPQLVRLTFATGSDVSVVGVRYNLVWVGYI